jgi:thioredoxin reductase
MKVIETNGEEEKNNNILDEKRNKDNNAEADNEIFDVAIIGGGFAGLSAALLLGRYLRPTIIFDVKKPKKGKIHGYLGFEKSPREELVQKSWMDVLQYNSIKKTDCEVEKVERDLESNLFSITTKNTTNDGKDQSDGRKRKAKSRYLIIATGINHQKPIIRNFEEYYGNGIWHCPHCDGFEATNKKLVIIASGNNKDESLDYAKLFLGWTKDITLFLQRIENKDNDVCERDVNKISQIDDKQRKEAMTLEFNVIENDYIVEIIGDSKKNSIKGVITKKNDFYEADVLFYHFDKVIRNEIAVQLGCELDEGYIKVNEKQQTSVPNVYAAGDIDTDRHYAILAAASGSLAAITIYEELLKDAIKSKKVESDDKH